MAVIEVPMISGFRADVESLERVIITLMNVHTLSKCLQIALHPDTYTDQEAPV